MKNITTKKSTTKPNYISYENLIKIQKSTFAAFQWITYSQKKSLLNSFFRIKLWCFCFFLCAKDLGNAKKSSKSKSDHKDEKHSTIAYIRIFDLRSIISIKPLLVALNSNGFIHSFWLHPTLAWNTIMLSTWFEIIRMFVTAITFIFMHTYSNLYGKCIYTLYLVFSLFCL